MINTPRQVDSDVKRILAEANLHRIRGRWHAATEACMDALCVDPANVSAHSLMGDIYNDQGRIDDAIQWYCLAIDLNPDNLSDREKLTRAVAERKKQLVEKPPQLNLHLVKSAFRRKHDDPNRTQFWRSERPVKIAIFIAAVLCLSIVVAWPIITARNGHAVATSSTAKQIDTDPIFLSAFSNEPSSTASGESSSDLMTDPSDHALLSKLRADQELLGRAIVVTEVAADPRSSRLTISYVSNPIAGAPVTRGQVVRNGIKVAQAAQADATLPQPLAFTMRGLIPTEHGGAPLGFVADINATDLLQVSPYDETQADSALEGRFTNVWWSSAVPGGTIPKAALSAPPSVAPSTATDPLPRAGLSSYGPSAPVGTLPSPTPVLATPGIVTNR